MCGICGFVSKRRITAEQLKTMNDTMYHRGPNDSGEEIAIVDQHNNLTIIIQVRSYKAVVITVINKTGIYIREGTKLEQIA